MSAPSVPVDHRVKFSVLVIDEAGEEPEYEHSFRCQGCDAFGTGTSLAAVEALANGHAEEGEA